MTPGQMLQRRVLILRLVLSQGAILLMVVGFIVVAVARNPVGLLVVGAGLGVRLVLSVLTHWLANHVAQQTFVDDGGARWWYDSRTGQVAQAPLPPASHFDGPYSSRANAERGPEIARERAAAWNAEDD